MKPKTKEVNLADLHLTADVQARNAVSETVVSEYAEVLEAGGEMPAITVYDINGVQYVTDGWHRVLAMRALGRSVTAAVVFKGSHINDAKWAAAAANRSHGLRRTNADKARAVALAVDANPEATYQELADWCGVSIGMIQHYFAGLREVEATVTDVAAATTTKPKRRKSVALAKDIEDKMQSAESEIDAVIALVVSAQAAVTELIETPAGAFVNGQSATCDLENAQSSLEDAKPFHVCPLCHGDGCGTCRMLGWVSKRQWFLIPAEHRPE